MKLFYSLLISTLLILIFITYWHYNNYKNNQKYINSIVKITSFPYFAVNSNFFEPNSYNLHLGKYKNISYPWMIQINKMDFIYE